MDFVFDIDGTICFDGYKIEDNIFECLKKHKEYSHNIIFASARPFRDCIYLLKDEFKNNYVIGLNGGIIFKDGKVIFSSSIYCDEYLNLIDFCHKNNIAYFVDDIWDYSYHIKDNIPFIDRVNINNTANYKNIYDIKNPVKMVVCLENKLEYKDEILNRLNSNKFDLMYHEVEKCIYINSIGINKYTSLSKISNEYVCFGNDKNDIDMFKHALYSIQVGNYKELSFYSDKKISKNDVHYEILQCFNKFK